ncbi:MAG: hypothetical protein JXB35_09225 [Anaerolineae bacterium]|nr:hypothetical protein [Anaerolineae bacterium]
MANKRMAVAGSSFICLGIVLLVSFLAPSLWPFIMIGIGGIFLFSAFLFRTGGLAIPGSLIGGLGVLFLGQTLTRNWASWLYAWPVVPGLVGMGLFTGNLLGMGGKKVRTVGLVWMGEALVVSAGLWFWYTFRLPGFSWAFILMGLGVMFAVAAILTGIGAKMIPGAIIGGLGALLYWQHMTGFWESWSYAWTLIPAFVGVGLITAQLLGMGGRAVRKVGIHLVGWSMLAFLTFGTFFAFGGRLTPFWPVLLVVFGAGIVVNALARRNPQTQTA